MPNIASLKLACIEAFYLNDETVMNSLSAVEAGKLMRSSQGSILHEKAESAAVLVFMARR